LLEVFRANYAHARWRLIERNIKTRCRDNHLLSFRFTRWRTRRGFLSKANDRREAEERNESDRVAHPSRVLASASRDRGLFLRTPTPRDLCVRKRLFRRDAETSTRDARATPSKPD